MRIIHGTQPEGIRARTEIDTLCGHFVSQCRRRGVRLTMQRMAVYRALAEDTTHPSVQSVCEKLRHLHPALSIATVYRILESLANEGLIRRLSTTRGILRFDANVDPHQHFICRLCDRIQDIKEESLSKLKLADTRLKGFSAEEIDIRVVGTCGECRRHASAANHASNKPVIGRRTGSTQ
jgi:Fur family transcriptional regulator, peroxide stress response regulator